MDEHERIDDERDNSTIGYGEVNDKPIYYKEVKVMCPVPECGEICDGTIEQYDGEPFPTYDAECKKCGYLITESEFDQITEV